MSTRRGFKEKKQTFSLKKEIRDDCSFIKVLITFHCLARNDSFSQRYKDRVGFFIKRVFILLY